MHTPKLFILSGPSGVGKTTILKHIMQKYNSYFNLSTSWTTRLPRPNEKNKIDYFFKTEEEFRDAIDNNLFLEWAQYSNHYYGTPKEFITASFQNHKSVILEIEVVGAKKIMRSFPECISIFIYPPDNSLDVLEQRVKARTKTWKNISPTPDNNLMRFKTAINELNAIHYYKYAIENNDFPTTIQELDKIIEKEILI